MLADRPPAAPRALAIAPLCSDPWPPIQSLPLFLQSFEGPGLPPDAHPAIGVHWILFGSSGHVTRPTRGALRSYTRCLQLRHGQHALVKSIVRTA